MSNRLLSVVLRRAESLAVERSADGQSDADLLRRFMDSRDETAFSIVVHRHGPMIWAVCRQMLSNPTDADDAFQAVFLALIQSGSKLVRVTSLGGWLHAVAVRVCLKARRTTLRRRQREQANAKAEGIAPSPRWDDLHAAVHEEVERLPESLRTAFVLCDLQGVRQHDAATQLGWKLGTLSGRLTRARQMLLKNLTARGLAPVLAVGTVSIGGIATGGVPSTLTNGVFALLRNGAGVSTTVLELARGATEGLMTKIKLTVGSMMAATGLTLALGTGWLPTADAQRPAATPPGASPGSGYGASTAAAVPAGADTAPVTAAPTPTPATRSANTAPSASAPSSQRYEHKTDAVPSSQLELTAVIRNWESGGWEFVGQVSGAGDTPYTRLVFKRPKGGAATASTTAPVYATFPNSLYATATATAPTPTANTPYQPVPTSYPALVGSLPNEPSANFNRPSAPSPDLVPARSLNATLPTGTSTDTKPAAKSTLSSTPKYSTGGATAPATTGDVLVIKLKSLAAEEARKLIAPILGDDYKERGGAVDVVVIPDSSTVVLYGASKAQTDKIQALLSELDTAPVRK